MGPLFEGQNLARWGPEVQAHVNLLVFAAARPTFHAVGARDIVVIGASSGGVEAVSRVVANLPRDLEASVFVVIHVAPTTPSVLPRILSQNGHLSATHAVDGEPIRRGHIYVAPPGRHLLLLPDRVGVTMGPRENMVRPAVDVLFRSAANVFRQRVIGVILTGALDDGAVGLWAVKARGGHTIVQDPAEAVNPGMPSAAIEAAHPDQVLGLDDIGGEIARLVREAAARPAVPAAKPDVETDIQRRGAGDVSDDVPGKLTQLVCPECHGPLKEIDDGGGVIHFRCHTGHAFSPESLLASQADDIERALWVALRALEEDAALARRVGSRHERALRRELALHYHERAQVAEENAATIKQLLKLRATEAAE